MDGIFTYEGSTSSPSCQIPFSGADRVTDAADALADANTVPV